MKKYGFLVVGVFIASFLSLSQAMYKRKVSDAFGAEESGNSVKVLREEKTIDDCHIKPIENGKYGSSDWHQTEEFNTKDNSENMLFAVSKNNRWALVLNCRAYFDRGLFGQSLVFYSLSRGGNSHTFVEEPVEIDAEGIDYNNEENDGTHSNIMTLSENNNYLFLQMPNKKPTIFRVDLNKEQGGGITRLQTVVLPGGVCVNTVKASTGRQGWYMAGSDGSVQCMVMDGDITLSEKWRHMSTTGKLVQEMHQISDGRLLVNYGDFLEILSADGRYLSEVKPLYQEPIDYVAVSPDFRIAYIVQKVNADSGAEQPESLTSEIISDNTSSGKGGVVISAWELPELNQEPVGGEDTAPFNKCIAQAWFRYNGLSMPEDVTVSAVALKSDWKEIYVGWSNGYLGETTLDPNLTTALDNSLMNNLKEAETCWLSSSRMFAISTLEWRNDKNLLLAHYQDGHAVVYRCDSETSRNHYSIVLKRSGENKCNSNSLGMFLSGNGSYLMKISKKNVGLYINKAAIGAF